MRCLQPHRTAQRQGWVSAHTSTLHTRRRPWRDAKPRLCAAKAQRSQSDCVALGNLCVDVVLPVDELPTSAPQSAERRALLSGVHVHPRREYSAPCAFHSRHQARLPLSCCVNHAELSGQTFPEESKEVGGNLNFVIAAQRCGLAVTSIGHVGRDSYGEFMETVLQVRPSCSASRSGAACSSQRGLLCVLRAQGHVCAFGATPLALPCSRVHSSQMIACTPMCLFIQAEDPTHVLQRILSHGEATSSGQHVASAHTAPSTNGKANGHSNGHSKGNGKAQTTAKPAGTMDVDDVDQTLVCFVLVDPNSKHAFCSRYDFGPWPLLGTMSRLPEPALKVSDSPRSTLHDSLIAVYVVGICMHSQAASLPRPAPLCVARRAVCLSTVPRLSQCYPTYVCM